MWFLDSLMPDAMKNYEYTWEDIEQYEKQGIDVTEMKAEYLAKQQLKEELRFWDKSDENVDVTKLDQYTPFDINSQFAKDTVGTWPWLFGKAKRKEENSNATIKYACVVQCDSHLWKSVSHEDLLPTTVVYVSSLNEKYSKDVSLLKKIAERLIEFSDENEKEVKNSTQYSDATKKLWKDLDKAATENVHTFTSKLDQSVFSEYKNLDEFQLYVWTEYLVEDKKLPWKKLPSDWIIPFVSTAHTNIPNSHWLSSYMNHVPAKYWSKN